MCGRRGFVIKAKDHKEIGKENREPGTAVGAAVSSEPGLTETREREANTEQTRLHQPAVSRWIWPWICELLRISDHDHDHREEGDLLTSGLRSGTRIRIHIDIMAVSEISPYPNPNASSTTE